MRPFHLPAASSPVPYGNARAVQCFAATGRRSHFSPIPEILALFEPREPSGPARFILCDAIRIVALATHPAEHEDHSTSTGPHSAVFARRPH